MFSILHRLSNILILKVTWWEFVSVFGAVRVIQSSWPNFAIRLLGGSEAWQAGVLQPRPLLASIQGKSLFDMQGGTALVFLDMLMWGCLARPYANLVRLLKSLLTLHLLQSRPSVAYNFIGAVWCVFSDSGDDISALITAQIVRLDCVVRSTALATTSWNLKVVGRLVILLCRYAQLWHNYIISFKLNKIKFTQITI